MFVRGQMICGDCLPSMPRPSEASSTPLGSIAFNCVWLAAVAIALVTWAERTKSKLPQGIAPNSTPSWAPASLSSKVDDLFRLVDALGSRIPGSGGLPTTLPSVNAEFLARLAEVEARCVRLAADDLELATRELRAAIRRETTSRDALEAKMAAIESRLASMSAAITGLAERIKSMPPLDVEPPTPPSTDTPDGRPASFPAPATPPTKRVDPEPTPGVTPELAALGTRLRDPAAGVRFTAVVALGGTRSPAAVPALIDALRDRESYVRDAAVRALRGVGAIEPVPDLIRALNDSDDFVRYSARDALRALTGMSLPFDPDASIKDREVKARAIEQWWEKERIRRAPSDSKSGG